MNTFKTTFLIFCSFLIISCGDDDSSGPGDPPTDNNQFTIAETDYATPNAYLLLSSAFEIDVETGEGIESYSDDFAIILSDGIFVQSDELGLSTSATNLMGLFYESDDEPVSSLSEINLSAQSYVNDADECAYAVGLTVSDYEDIFVVGASEYGSPVENSTVEGGDGETVRIIFSTVDIDYDNRSGDVAFTYEFVDEMGMVVIGAYEGSIAVIVEE